MSSIAEKMADDLPENIKSLVVKDEDGQIHYIRQPEK